MSYRLWVNEESTVLVRQFSEDGIEVALRASRHHVWGPPILLAPEKLHEPYEQAAPKQDGEAAKAAIGTVI